MGKRPGSIESMREQLKSCMADLSSMPRHKAGSEWHTDRVAEARWLVGAIERMEQAHAARTRLAELN